MLKEKFEEDFVGMSKDDLLALCASCGLKPHINSGEEKLKQILRDEYTKRTVTRKLDQSIMNGLTGFPWGGLRKLITLRRPEGVKNNKKVRIGWNGNIIDVPYDVPNVSIPEPHLLVMIDAKSGTVNVTSKPNGAQPDIDAVYTSRHNVVVHGDDPNSKTEFSSLKEYLVSMWDVVSVASNREKIAILSQLTDTHINRAYVKLHEWDENDVNEHLRALLGIEE